MDFMYMYFDILLYVLASSDNFFRTYAEEVHVHVVKSCIWNIVMYL